MPGFEKRSARGNGPVAYEHGIADDYCITENGYDGQLTAILTAHCRFQELETTYARYPNRRR